MANVNFGLSNKDKLNKRHPQHIGVDGETVTAGNTSDPVYCPSDERVTLVTIDPTAATSGKIEYSQSPMSAIQADSGVWYDWPEGDVTDITSRQFALGVTAVRASAVGGSITWSMSAG